MRRRVVGTNLRRLRERLGMTLEDAARELSCHSAKISRIEAGRSGVRQLDLRVLLDLYGVTDPEERAGWLALARESREQRWWRVLENRLPQEFVDLAGLEDEITMCRGFQPGIVPGLFQTEEYAAAVIREGRTGVLNPVQQDKLHLRLERQKALTRDRPAPLDVWMILGEAALRQQLGGEEVLRRQLSHLIEMARLPNVTVQVLPFTSSAVPSGPYPFLLYSFPSPIDLEVALLENFTGHTYLEAREDTEPLRAAFDHLRACALSPLDSEAMILRVRDEPTASRERSSHARAGQ
ncbi:helix-turn-helix transcriptional regulator [Streptomyces sp. ST2-7A]|uniref:helix-turn-helix domain-containing protein n=1 Tax=Streptomyces sp. ST2-7A TaxID=2907214 RepID=UPI001F3E7E0B|nr:helix-turn-helix transcriptional regulator [Streptomyces sp. ST2-7A]MCE7078724.1 helix-turn-helix domain-containing protein [Streptomyces sp. ST2-7A]